jgi:hypothetical protein
VTEGGPAPEGVPQRFSLMPIMLGNATLLSIIYLVVAVLIEATRRYLNFRWSERASLAMESLPARVLDLLHLMAPLRREYVYGNLSEVVVRLVFGVTTVAIIFLMALVVGGGMWALRMLWEKRAL